MPNVSDLTIVGIVAALGVIVVVASFGRRRRRQTIRCRSPINDNGEYLSSAVTLNCRATFCLGMEHAYARDNSYGQTDVIHRKSCPSVFHNILAAYSFIPPSPTAKILKRSITPEPLYSTWVKHAARGQDEIIIDGPIPYLVSEKATRPLRY